jgi:hypothetical protein
VSLVIKSTGGVVEWVKYATYGTPFNVPGQDFNSSGTLSTQDVNDFLTIFSAPGYDVRGDFDMNGSLTTQDYFDMVTELNGDDQVGGLGIIARLEHPLADPLVSQSHPKFHSVRKSKMSCTLTVPDWL